MATADVTLEEPHATALLWIVGVLRDANVPFQVTGGVAARLYGARRPLADIDLDVPGFALPRLAELLAKHVVFGPATYRDRYWELDLLTVVGNDGVTIDIGACDGKMFSAAPQSWVPAHADVDAAVEFEVLGTRVPVVNREALVAYKQCLGRDVDLLDLAAMDASAMDARSLG
jgi:aminoglycoside-2''-adenylyltransferase